MRPQLKTLVRPVKHAIEDVSDAASEDAIVDY